VNDALWTLNVSVTSMIGRQDVRSNVMVRTSTRQAALISVSFIFVASMPSFRLTSSEIWDPALDFGGRTIIILTEFLHDILRIYCRCYGCEPIYFQVGTLALKESKAH